ncbi:hypothetical protein FN846DRAFT_570580 [Sphaerosporella brunnea]|uniref:Uncharacterized protein n=1 Tax=Sphaerosporella brunnea TaxID=1250544 RepID=A0A5J5F2W5_9PEZI|nr:hypothetical protein FN846DRAFT_570580 [Sphaerosporella brunnea]
MKRKFDGIMGSMKSVYHALRNNPQKTKRMLKTALALTTALSLTLPPPLANFHGQNPFLVGTIAIYLFPNKTVGGQILGTSIGALGILLGLSYSNFWLFIAGLVQKTDSDHVNLHRRLVLLCAFALAAFLAGYVRSKHSRSYLGMNFFMLVNMFCLIRGITNFQQQFHSYFYPMFIGGGISLFVSIAVWPEDRGGALKREVIKGVNETKVAITALRHIMKSESCEEVDLKGIKAAEQALAASLHEANYEFMFSRVDSSYLVPLQRCMARLVSTCRALNASVRRKHRTRPVGDLGCSMGLTSIHTRLSMDGVFANASGLLDAIARRIEELHSGSSFTLLDHERFAQNVEQLMVNMSFDVQNRVIADIVDMEEAAFTDQINTMILDIMDICKDMARATAFIQPITKSIRIILPRKLCRREFELSEPSLNDDARADAISRFDAMSRGRSMMATDEAYLLYKESTTPFERARVWVSERLMALNHSRHVKYAVKFTVVMVVLALPAFIANWYIWYNEARAQLAMISALVAMETTRGMTIRTAFMKLIGALCGATFALAVVEASLGIYAVSIVLTVPIGLGVGWVILDARLSKAATVCSLAYNLILGIATVTSGPVEATLAKRLATLPVGLLVAGIVHMTLFPYHAREEMVKGLGSSLDWLHHLLFAIELSTEDPTLQTKYDSMVQNSRNRIGFAKSLLPATHYEFSIGGHWPYKRFEGIVDKIIDIMDIIVGEVSADPVLAVHMNRSTACASVRTKLLATLCNDLLVISHTLSARLFMPRHPSLSNHVLHEYMHSLLLQLHAMPSDSTAAKDYVDVGRLADLVHEMDHLRTMVDELTTETQCPKNGLRPHLSFVRRSRPSTAVTRRSRPGTPGNSTPRGYGAATPPSRSRAPSVLELDLRSGRRTPDVVELDLSGGRCSGNDDRNDQQRDGYGHTSEETITQGSDENV